MSRVKILGIDPGVARLGWGVIEKSKVKNLPRRQAYLVGRQAGQKLEIRNRRLKLVACGCIRTKTGEEMSKRLLSIYRELRNLLRIYQPDLIAIEQLFFGANAKTAIIVGQATGIVLLTAAQAKTSVVEFAPLKVKSYLSGYGRTKKLLIQAAVKKVLHLKETLRADDTADALAIAICAADAD